MDRHIFVVVNNEALPGDTVHELLMYKLRLVLYIRHMIANADIPDPDTLYCWTQWN